MNVATVVSFCLHCPLTSPDSGSAGHEEMKHNRGMLLNMQISFWEAWCFCPTPPPAGMSVVSDSTGGPGGVCVGGSEQDLLFQDTRMLLIQTLASQLVLPTPILAGGSWGF